MKYVTWTPPKGDTMEGRGTLHRVVTRPLPDGRQAYCDVWMEEFALRDSIAVHVRWIRQRALEFRDGGPLRGQQ